MKNVSRPLGFPLWEAALLAGIVALGFCFRWLYARHVSFFVDEYLTARAAERILSRGLPLLPSGNYYSHGQLLSYLEAAVLALGGRQAWLMRLPVVALSTAAIALTWWFGRRISSPAVGLVAAALLAVSPESILWGGRLRMYAPLQFFVLTATVVFYFWVLRERDRPHLIRCSPLLFVLAYWAAILSHAEAMLLLPIWGLWALAQRGWRWCLRPTNLFTFVLSGLAVVLEIGLRRLGPPVQSRIAEGVLAPISRQYLGPALDWAGLLKVVEPLFLTPTRLLLTLLVMGGAVSLLVAWLARSKPRLGVNPPGTAGERRTLGYLYALLLPTLALLLFVMDPSWKSPRYGLMLLPHFFLIAVLLLAWIGRWLLARLGPRRARLSRLAVAAVVGLIAVVSWPSARAATRESVPGYDWAFAYVEGHQQPGDVVITFLCPAAFFHLGRCDYLAIPTDFSGFATEKEGRWVSGWDGAPLLDGADDLRAVLDSTSCAWFVVDEGRFARRYDDEFVQTVLDRMEPVAADHEVLVFRSKEQYPAEAIFGDAIRLFGYDLLPGPTVSLLEDGALTVTLFWQAVAPVEGDYTVFVHLVDAQGRIQAQGDGPPLEGARPTSSWQVGEMLLDGHPLALDPEMAPGEYRLLVGLYTLQDGARLPVTDGPGADSVTVATVVVRPHVLRRSPDRRR